MAGDLRRNGDPPDRCDGQLGLYFGQQRGGAKAHMGPERLGESLGGQCLFGFPETGVNRRFQVTRQLQVQGAWVGCRLGVGIERWACRFCPMRLWGCCRSVVGQEPVSLACQVNAAGGCLACANRPGFLDFLRNGRKRRSCSRRAAAPWEQGLAHDGGVRPWRDPFRGGFRSSCHRAPGPRLRAYRRCAWRCSRRSSPGCGTAPRGFLRCPGCRGP